LFRPELLQCRFLLDLQKSCFSQYLLIVGSVPNIIRQY
jgi:hypothetical protein